MATLRELRTIIKKLQLVDIGDAASYLGEEKMGGQNSQHSKARLVSELKGNAASLERRAALVSTLDTSREAASIS